ncbi:uncharacterized protein [Watersipora subatra]|uniref:uncharacterized protein n=1 Tax=Watersipora subatra TaxID=2589382 RepID=UPI00355B70F5
MTAGQGLRKLDKARHQEETQGPGEGKGQLDPNRIRYHQSLLKRHELLERIKAANGQDLRTGGGENLRAFPVRTGEIRTDPLLPSPPRSPMISAAHVLKRRNSNALRISDDLELRNRPVPSYPPPPAWPAPYPPYPPAPPYNHYHALGPPTVLPLATIPQQSNKSEYFDMMMLQNAQMHQLFVQQMLTQGLRPKEESQPVIIEQQSPPSLPPQPQVLTLPQNKRPRSRHHHYYTQLPPIANERSYQINHIQHIEERKPSTIRSKTPEKRRSPSPKVIRIPRPLPAAPLPVRKIETKKKFPGSDALRKLRHVAYAAWFVSFLKIAARKRKEDDKFLFGIRLKEAIGALHRIYLNPDGNIYPLLRDIISPGATDLKLAFKENQNSVLQELVYITENILFHMTDIMPKTGVLGTHRKAVVFEMLLEGKVYPNGYFWEIEKNGLKFDEEGKTMDIDDDRARSLLIGMFLSRGLVTTLLMKPLDYGMSTTLLDETAEDNLKLVASIFVYIVRKVAVPKNSRMLPVPTETAIYLYSDEELKPLLSKIQQTIEYGEEILRDWMKEYIRRLRQAKEAL